MAQALKEWLQSSPEIGKAVCACERVDLTSEQERAWSKARSKFMWEGPGFCHILYTMMAPDNLSPDKAIFTSSVPIAATDGRYLMLNPETFFKDYSLSEQVFIMGHEV